MADLIGTDETWGAVRDKLNNRAARNPSLVVRLGDSRTEFEYSDPSTQFNRTTRDGVAWANAMMGLPFREVANYGISGSVIEAMQPYVAPAIATGAGYCFILDGLNNTDAAKPGAKTAAGMFDALDQLLVQPLIAAGMRVGIMLEPGANSANGKIAIINEYIARIVSAASSARWGGCVDVFDIREAVLDPTGGAIAYKSGFSFDGAHMNGKGGYSLGKWLAPKLSGIFPQRPQGLTVDWDAQGYGANQAFRNPMFVTTTGGTAGSGITGSVPANWAMDAVNGSATVSTGAASDGIGNELIVNATWSADGGYVRLYQGITSQYLFAGDILSPEFDISVDASPTNLGGVGAYQSYQTDGGAVETAYDLNSGGFGALPSEAMSYRTGAPRRTLAPFTTLNFYAGGLYIRGAGGSGSATVRIRRATNRKSYD
ncbi:hypothetical protein J2X45_003971 [Caulobacter sp. BE264]|uniref:SGNH/GDSL hydrolase family protein n=1 Tax=Caulobacter sp. BE264 TaxID=2817724 RepID=UPI0028594AFE|nr:SGNH/GDSL hydrolase family protein [Caulobacter sp. BE264]MDR7232855.1 hypothetical protein [Caulobacter sp. BE264]